MFRTCKSHSDQCKCLNDLANQCIVIRNKNKYPSHDARTVGLNNLEGITRSGQMILNLLDSWTIGDNNIRQIIPQLIGLKTVTQESVKEAGNLLNKSSKLSFCILGQFQIENLIRNIGRDLKVNINSTGFYRVAASLLKTLNFKDSDMEILNVPSRIRNSLHGNGIHHSQSRDEKEEVDVKGVKYIFRDKEKVSCTDWEHISNAFEGSLEIIDKIIGKPEVNGIPEIIDQYAWDVATDSMKSSGV